MTRYFVLAILLFIAFTVNSFGSGIDAALEAQVIVNVPDEVNKGDTFQVTINVENIRDLAGFQFDLKYSANILQCQSGMVKGTFLGNSTYWIDPVIDNATGQATGILCVRTKSGGVDGSGVLASLTFKSISQGTASIVMKNVLMLDSDIEEIPVSLIGGYVEVRSYPKWDVNQDGLVNVIDLLLVAFALNQYVSADTIPNPDVDRSGRVTIADLVLVAQHFGESFTNAAPAKEVKLSASDILVLRDIRETSDSEVLNKLLGSLLENVRLPKAIQWGAIKVR